MTGERGAKDAAAVAAGGEGAGTQAAGGEGAVAAAARKDPRRTFIAALAAVFLAFTYLALGYAVCAGVPFVAEKVALSTVDAEGSPFGKEQLVEGALAVRDYSFGSHDLAALEEALRSMNAEAQTPYADAADVFAAPGQYTVGADAVAHLDDVYELASRLMMPVCGVAAIAAFLLFAGFRMFGTRAVASMLLGGGAIAAAVLLGLGLWCLVSFDSFFAALHGLFFAEGSWTFPADSLLITMLPGPFWAAMGGVWFAVSMTLAVLSAGLGLALRRRRA